MRSSLPLGRRDTRSQQDPKDRCIFCPPPARTPSSGLAKTAGIHGDHDAPAAGPQAPFFARLIMGKMGGQSEAAFPYLLTEVSLKAAPAASIRVAEAQAPSPRNASLREQKGNPEAPAISLSKAHSYFNKKMQKI